MRVIQAPHSTAGTTNTVFLAGSIEMGKAIKWQDEIIEKCKDTDITFFNPRRDDWDDSWEQSITNEKFRKQVEWELRSLNKANKIVMYFDKDSLSPITLLELGLHARADNLCVCCPDGYWRKGNVEIICEKYHIPMVETIDELVTFIKE